MENITHYTCAIIVAAGNSVRMNCGMNKNFLQMNNTYAISLTLKAFDECSLVDEIIFVHKKGECNMAKQAVDEAVITKPVIYTEGGSTRQESVYNGLLSAPSYTTHVAIHDGARILITPEIIDSVVKKAFETGAATPATKAKDTCAFVLDENANPVISEFIDRTKLFMIQTPQCFSYSLITSAHEKAQKDGFEATDDTSIASYAGNKVSIIINNTENPKLTNPEDIYTVESILAYRNKAKIKEG